MGRHLSRSSRYHGRERRCFVHAQLPLCPISLEETTTTTNGVFLRDERTERERERERKATGARTREDGLLLDG